MCRQLLSLQAVLRRYLLDAGASDCFIARYFEMNRRLLPTQLQLMAQAEQAGNLERTVYPGRVHLSFWCQDLSQLSSCGQ